MTIAICGKWCIYDGQFGGIPMYNRGAARGYVELGHQVVLVCPKWDRSLPDESEVAPGIRVRRLEIPRIPSRLMRGRMGELARFVESWHISRAVKRELNRLVHAGALEAAEFAESSLEGYHSVGKIGIPHLVRCHTPLGLLRKYYLPQEFRQNRLAIAMEAALVNRAPALTTPSEDLRQQVVSLFGVAAEKVSVVPNPVESDIYRPLEGARPEQAPIVLHVGRLDSRKGGTVLGEAAPYILEKIPDARVVFAGENRPGLHGEGVASQILRGCPAAARERLEFRGEVDEAALVELYSQSQVCVVPSMIYESFSYTAAQAMSCARPVVAARIGGIPEVVEDSVTGLLVEPGDARALGKAVVRLLDDPNLRTAMGASGRTRVTDYYVPDRVAEQNCGILNTSAASGQRRAAHSGH